MAVAVGDGTTITFGTSGFNANIISISGPDSTRSSVDTSHLGSSGWMTFLASGLVDGGTVSLEIQYDPTITMPIAAVAETVTIDPAGSGQTLVFSAFATATGHSFVRDELMTATMELKVTGAITGI